MTSPRLLDLPNIGPEIDRLLRAADIHTPATLRRLGSIAAALRIRDLRPDDPPCPRMLAGLEGALRGVRGHDIPKPERDLLWNRYQQRLAQHPR